MKRKTQKIGAISLALLALALNVNAQWTEIATAVYLNSTTKNVGIGTTTPAFALDLIRSGSANLSLKSTTGTSNLLLDRANSAATSSVSYRTNGVGTWQTGTVGNDNFAIRNLGSANSAMTINATNNNVGIGVPTPTYKLHVQGNAFIKELLRVDSYAPAIRLSNQGSDIASLGLHQDLLFLRTMGPSQPIHIAPWGTNGLYLNSDTRIGMGTYEPQSNLHVYGIYPDLRIQGQNGLGTINPVRMSFWSDPQGSAQEWRPGYIQVDDSAAGTYTGIMRFFTNGTSSANKRDSVEGMRIINGRVGIYDSLPDVDARLSVGGNVTVKGDVIKLGNKTITSVGAFETQFNSDVLATSDGSYYCGTSAIRWASVYAVNGVIQTSDSRMKKEIKDLPYGLNEVMKLQPVSYKWNDEKLGDDTNLGFLAQDLQKVVKEVVVDHTTRFNKETNKMETTPNEVLGVKYSELIPVLVKAIQEQQTQIVDLQNENASMKDCLNAVCNNGGTSKTAYKNLDVVNTLFQNQPNPFNQTTVIRYALNSDNNNGKIIIRDLNGNLVKQINIANGGKGQVTINANELSAGTYTYTLEIAGASVDTKLMVVTK